MSDDSKPWLEVVLAIMDEPPSKPFEGPYGDDCICDRCGKREPASPGDQPPYEWARIDVRGYASPIVDGEDLCGKCLKALLDWMARR